MSSSDKEICNKETCDKATQYEDHDVVTFENHTNEKEEVSKTTSLSLTNLVTKAQEVTEKVVCAVKNPADTYHSALNTGKQALSSACSYVSGKLDSFKKCLVVENKESK